MKQEFNVLDMTLMPDNGTAIALEDKLLIMDSLDSPVVDDLHGFIDLFPMKLAKSCLLVVVSGCVQLSVNFSDIVATDNTCLLFPEGTIVEKAVFDAHARVILLSFGHLNTSSMAQYDLHRLSAIQARTLHLQEEHVNMLQEVYRLLRTIMTDDAFAYNRMDTAAHCVNLMASILGQGLDEQSQLDAKPSRQDEIVSRFLECVHENYREHRELGFYAEKLRLSLKYMSHVIHGQTGRHPSQWIKDYVILDAKTMLRSGRYSVQQVADELHFPNQSFFGKYFKEAVGVSPKKWK